MKISQIIKELLPDEKLDLQNLDISNNFAGQETSALDFIYGDTTLIFSGPPLLSQALKYPDLLYQVGATTSLGVSQNKMYVNWDEFGYKYIRSLPGKVQNTISIEKIHTSHSNIVSALYKWLVKLMVGQKKQGVKFASYPGVNPLSPDTASSTLDTYSSQMFNLSSEMFCVPFGLFIIQLDGNLDIKLLRYAELCKLPSLNEGFNSNPVSSENVQIPCTRIIPAIGLKVKTKDTKKYTMPGPAGSLKPSIATNVAEPSAASTAAGKEAKPAIGNAAIEAAKAGAKNIPATNITGGALGAGALAGLQ